MTAGFLLFHCQSNRPRCKRARHHPSCFLTLYAICSPDSNLRHTSPLSSYLLSDLKRLNNKPELILSAAPSARPVARRRLWLRSAPKRTICYLTRTQRLSCTHTHTQETRQSRWTPPHDEGCTWPEDFILLFCSPCKAGFRVVRVQIELADWSATVWLAALIVEWWLWEQFSSITLDNNLERINIDSYRRYTGMQVRSCGP